jgi:hypothetical protein
MIVNAEGPAVPIHDAIAWGLGNPRCAGMMVRVRVRSTRLVNVHIADPG